MPPTKTTERTTTFIDHVLTNSSQRVSQYSVRDPGLSDYGPLFCT